MDRLGLRAILAQHLPAGCLEYDQAAREYAKLDRDEIEARLANGSDVVSAKFVIPYPPGFPITVPSQVITRETVTFMRRLDVEEIHGYDAASGLELLKPEALAALRAAKPSRRRHRGD